MMKVNMLLLSCIMIGFSLTDELSIFYPKQNTAIDSFSCTSLEATKNAGVSLPAFEFTIVAKSHADKMKCFGKEKNHMKTLMKEIAALYSHKSFRHISSEEADKDLQCAKDSFISEVTSTEFSTEKLADAFAAIRKVLDGKNVIVLRIVAPIQTLHKKLLEESEEGLAEGTATIKEVKKVYARPGAVLGLGLTLFISIILWIGISCMMESKGPAEYATKEFKYGREM